MKSLVWFRRDLRVTDNTALFQACQASTQGVIGLYLVSAKQWKEHGDADAKIKFWLENVRALSAELGRLRIPLLIRVVDWFDDAPQQVVKVAKKHGCSALWFNREYEVNERRRDDNVMAVCHDAEITVRRYHDRVVVPPREIATKQGNFYSVFTPYRRVWNQRAVDYIEVLPVPKKQPQLEVQPSRIPAAVDGFDFSGFRDDLWAVGESEGQTRLEDFVESIVSYDTARDIPSVRGTSLLSPYLVAGVISPRQCMTSAFIANQGQVEGDSGAAVWISELAWRDFYTHVMVHCPRVSMHRPFKENTDALAWRRDPADFKAWAEGRTGYPIVDAGMRQLNRTGWMHNRLRMVTAMFLTKNLLIDWRMGEQYFMEHLIDGDLAANNGGWQWSASTGTDAAPYFRIFNPFSQSKRFDSDGSFIKKMCPELKDVPPAALHDPKKLTAAIQKTGIDYPDYVVDYKPSRERALAAFKALK